MANAQHHTPYTFGRIFAKIKLISHTKTNMDRITDIFKKEPLNACEEFEMQNSVNLEPLGVNDVAENYYNTNMPLSQASKMQTWASI
ncbi:hypothetical protein NQ318_017764 [Aromia moschata]|uniref:Uncharacterized protein n=1 Tax=Aromia moschata TaxID=1265417 RepID=A0AAV8XUZ6_9CUCU|nr:hypothetical protein NQ318_017764 [Aromia moschata]